MVILSLPKQRRRRRKKKGGKKEKERRRRKDRQQWYVYGPILHSDFVMMITITDISHSALSLRLWHNAPRKKT